MQWMFPVNNFFDKRDNSEAKSIRVRLITDKLSNVSELSQLPDCRYDSPLLSKFCNFLISPAEHAKFIPTCRLSYPAWSSAQFYLLRSLLRSLLRNPLRLFTRWHTDLTTSQNPVLHQLSQESITQPADPGARLAL